MPVSHRGRMVARSDSLLQGLDKISSSEIHESGGPQLLAFDTTGNDHAAYGWMMIGERNRRRKRQELPRSAKELSGHIESWMTHAGIWTRCNEAWNGITGHRVEQTVARLVFLFSDVSIAAENELGPRCV